MSPLTAVRPTARAVPASEAVPSRTRVGAHRGRRGDAARPRRRRRVHRRRRVRHDATDRRGAGDRRDDRALRDDHDCHRLEADLAGTRHRARPLRRRVRAGARRESRPSRPGRRWAGPAGAARRRRPVERPAANRGRSRRGASRTAARRRAVGSPGEPASPGGGEGCPGGRRHVRWRARPLTLGRREGHRPHAPLRQWRRQPQLLVAREHRHRDPVRRRRGSVRRVPDPGQPRRPARPAGRVRRPGVRQRRRPRGVPLPPVRSAAVRRRRAAVGRRGRGRVRRRGVRRGQSTVGRLVEALDRPAAAAARSAELRRARVLLAASRRDQPVRVRRRPAHRSLDRQCPPAPRSQPRVRPVGSRVRHPAALGPPLPDERSGGATGGPRAAPADPTPGRPAGRGRRRAGGDGSARRGAVPRPHPRRRARRDRRRRRPRRDPLRRRPEDCVVRRDPGVLHPTRRVRVPRPDSGHDARDQGGEQQGVHRRRAVVGRWTGPGGSIAGPVVPGGARAGTAGERSRPMLGRRVDVARVRSARRGGRATDGARRRGSVDRVPRRSHGPRRHEPDLARRGQTDRTRGRDRHHHDRVRGRG